MSNSSDSNDPKQETLFRKKRPGFIHIELAAALEAWNELERSEIRSGPEEEQLLKIKHIIGQLREKLEHF